MEQYKHTSTYVFETMHEDKSSTRWHFLVSLVYRWKSMRLK